MSCAVPLAVRAKMLAAPDTVIAFGYAVGCVRESGGEREKEQREDFISERNNRASEQENTIRIDIALSPAPSTLELLFPY